MPYNFTYTICLKCQTDKNVEWLPGFRVHKERKEIGAVVYTGHQEGYL